MSPQIARGRRRRRRPRPARGPPALRWGSEVERFLAGKQEDAPVGLAWIRRMRWELGRFPRLVEPGVPERRSLLPRGVTRAHIDRLRSTRSWERATFAVHFAALRQFLAWAGNPLATEKAPWRLPSGEAGRRRWLSRDQLLRLAEQPPGPERALVLLEGFNGLRRVEVLRLRAKDVLFAEGSIRVLGKGRAGGKWRTIPMHPAVRIELERLTRGRPDDARLFEVSRSGADRWLQRAARRAGLGPPAARVSHHDLRRTFGRLAHSAGMDLVQLKNLLGHASVDMTAHYVGLDSDEMRAGLQRFVDGIGAPRSVQAPRGTPRGPPWPEGGAEPASRPRDGPTGRRPAPSDAGGSAVRGPGRREVRRPKGGRTRPSGDGASVRRGSGAPGRGPG